MSVGNPRSLLARVFSFVALATLALSGTLLAQGVTTGAVRGKVTDEAGNGVSGAVVVLTNTGTGLRYRTTSREEGIYNIENVTPGSPFALEARAIGYRPARRENFSVGLGQAIEINLSMSQAAVELAAITVSGASDNPLTSKSHTGAAGYVPDSLIGRLPTLSRNFTDFIGNLPQVNGTSIAGQNNRYNNIQIDGGVNNDLFGLGGTGTPGGQVGERPISIEAVKEYQVLIAPFDVRQGGFTGGLVNAVTRSGTNAFHGSAFFFGQNQGFGRKIVDRGPLGKDTLQTFHEYQYGFTASGPLVRDRLHFFVAADIKSRASPFFGSLGGIDSVDLGAFGMRKTTADSVASYVSRKYNVSTGSTGNITDDTPDRDLFVKLNGQVSEGSQVEFTFNSVKAGDGSLIRSNGFSGFRSGFELGNAGYRIENTTNTARLRYNATFGGRYTNELLLGYSAIRDNRNPGMMMPLVFVGGDQASNAIAFGAERFSMGNKLNQDVYEVSDNFTIGYGQHLFTVGTHNEFFKFFNQFFQGSYGVWAFANVDSLVANHPYHYEIALPLRPGGPVSTFKVNQLGAYVQDQWSVTPRLTLTYGVRVDAPKLGAPPDVNLKLRDSTVFAHVTGDTSHVDTHDFSTAALWSPRFGFNYDVNGDRSTLIRGGLGVFAGRPPYVWVSNAYANSGLTQALLSCGPSSPPATAPNADTLVPAFVPTLGTLDQYGVPNGQPTNCANSGPLNTSNLKASVVYFDHNFRFPQTFRGALGVDKTLPWGIVGTVDLLYTRTMNQFYLNDVNLKGVVGTSFGEGFRPLYGTSSSGRTPSASRISSSFNDVIRQSNSSGDYSYSATLQLNKRFSNHMELNGGYTYSKTYDRMCMTSSISNSNLRFAVLQGPLDNRPLATSCFDVPHNITFTGIFDVPFGIKLALTYNGQSGRPFTYTVNNDANGDGLGGNDPIYVPVNRSDIDLSTRIKNPANPTGPLLTTTNTQAVWDSLNTYITSESCLNNARGTLLNRNTCRNPWTNFINMRVSKSFPTISGQSFEVSLDIFNLPNLLSSSWGVNKSTTGFENQSIINMVSYSTAFGRGTYSLQNLSGRNAISAGSSRYRMLVSGRYTF
jgi:hypothetical protein